MDFCQRKWRDGAEPWEGNPAEAPSNDVLADFCRVVRGNVAEYGERNPAGAP